MTHELETLLDRLAEERAINATLRDAKRKMIDAVQQSEDYKMADAATAASDEIMTQLEEQIRTMTLGLWTEQKELPDRVTVKKFQTVKIIDEGEALQWSIRNFTPALQLNKKVFETAAKAGSLPNHIAVVEVEPRAQIATKLDRKEGQQ